MGNYNIGPNHDVKYGKYGTFLVSLKYYSQDYVLSGFTYIKVKSLSDDYKDIWSVKMILYKYMSSSSIKRNIILIYFVVVFIFKYINK